jgi:hypothetical protein
MKASEVEKEYEPELKKERRKRGPMGMDLYDPELMRSMAEYYREDAERETRRQRRQRLRWEK